MNTLELFAQRVIHEWLPVYADDRKRAYGVDGFKLESIAVDEADARDCMLALDEGIVIDTGGSRYRASRNSAHEVLFWEGAKIDSPRKISLWLEPVITFAALARLHIRYGWPTKNLGTQPPGWAFDVAAYHSESEVRPALVGEVKRSSTELARPNSDLTRLARGESEDAVLNNSLKKWQALLELKPSVLLLLGPAEEQFVYAVTYGQTGATLSKATEAAMEFAAV